MVVRMSNQLQYESSPYLLQHKDNPIAGSVSGERSRTIPICTRNVFSRFIGWGKTVTDDYGGISEGRRYTGNKGVFKIHSVGQHGANRTEADGRIPASE